MCTTHRLNRRKGTHSVPYLNGKTAFLIAPGNGCCELLLLRLLDEEYTRHPFKNGLLIVTVWLRAQGHAVNRKRVQRLMRILGLIAMTPGPDTRKNTLNIRYTRCAQRAKRGSPESGLECGHHRVRLAHGFVCLVAIIDWYSRKVLAWRVSNTMDVGFCVDCLTAALKQYGVTDIFNTDQGSHRPVTNGSRCYRKTAWTQQGWTGRALDNIPSAAIRTGFVERLWRSVKYEDTLRKTMLCT